MSFRPQGVHESLRVPSSARGGTSAPPSHRTPRSAHDDDGLNVGYGNYLRFSIVQKHRAAAAEERDEKAERAQFRRDQREKVRTRGMGLKQEQKEQKQRIANTLSDLSMNARRQGERLRQERGEREEALQRAQKAHVEYCQGLIAEEKAWEVRAIDAHWPLSSIPHTDLASTCPDQPTCISSSYHPVVCSLCCGFTGTGT